MSQPKKNNQKNTPKRPGFNWIHLIIVFLFITVVFNLVFDSFTKYTQTEITYDQFETLVDQHYVDVVQITDTTLNIALVDGVDGDKIKALLDLDRFSSSQVYYTGIIDSQSTLETLQGSGVQYYKQVTQSNSILSFITTWILPILILYLIYYLIIRNMMKRMGADGSKNSGGNSIFSVGRSRAKEYHVEANTHVTFDDVAGQDEAKEALNDIVDFLHNPKKYQKIGAKQPKGALLVGPPGTGKTLLAKAVAGEADVPFYSISGSEFIEMFVGVGASRVRDLFVEAKKTAPCIIFIDEIDAIGKNRDSQYGGNDEREQTLNQLLAEMDGFDGSTGIMVLAATNRPEVLDQALLRPGRFDRRIIVERPDLPGREAILKVHARKVRCGTDVDLNKIALATPGATGADLANMINEAALLAVKNNRDQVEQSDLMEAVESVIAGKEKKDRILNPKEKRLVAYHEVGHALVSALQTHKTPIQKITIVPRTMGSLGYTMNAPEDERYLMTKDELLAQITTLLGGRAAEIVEFSEITTGASNDIERATELARKMVTQYGMSDTFGSMGIETVQNQYLSGKAVANCADETAAIVDEEVRKLIEKCQASAVSLLNEHRPSLTHISEYLLKKENITGDEFNSLLKESEGEIPS